MKVFFTSASLLLAGALFAQQPPVVLTNAIFPAAGDVYVYDQDSDGQPAYVGLPGVQSYWDFTGFTADGQAVDSILDAAANPAGLLAFPSADIQLPLFGLQMMTDVTASEVNLLGTSINLFGNDFTLPLNNPLTVQKAPFAYGNSFVESTSAAIALDLAQFPQLDTFLNNQNPIPGTQIDSVRAGFEFNADVEVDAWGEVNIPSGSYNCIRLHRMNYSNVVIEAYISSFFGGFWIDVSGFIPAGTIPLGTDTIEQYEFRSDLTKEYVVLLNVNPLDGSIINANFRNEISPLSLDVVSAAADMEIYPNPAIDRVQVAFGGLPQGEYRLVVADALGRSTTDLGNFFHTGAPVEASVASLPNGIYWLRAYRPDGSLASTKPLCVKRP
jgi:hypothetical protein